jgi:RNA polymerase sigma factor (sigma-70 family)
MADRTAALAHILRVAKPAPDGDLLSAFVRTKDPAAFEALVRRHGPLVLAACRAVLSDPADADDACQAAFVALHRRAHTVRDPRTLGGWLFRVARRAALDLKDSSLRRQARERRAAKPEPVGGPDLSWREACAVLHEELDRLPSRYRLPLLLCYLEGRTQDEAAAELGWTRDSVRGRVNRGRELLRKRLERRGVTLSAGLAAAVAVPAGVSAELVRRIIENSPAPAVDAAARAAVGSGLRVAPTISLAAVAVALVAGTVLLDAAGDRPPKPVEAKPPDPEPAKRADAFGDPLPEGAIARLGTIRFNHGAGLRAWRYLPDGKSVVTVGNGLARVWDAESGAERRQFPIAAGSWNDEVAVSADGAQLVLLQQDQDDPIWVYDLATGKQVRKWSLPTRRFGFHAYRTNALSPDGRLALANTERVLLVFDTETGKELCRIGRAGESVQATAFAGPDRLVTAAKDGTMEVWEARTGKRIIQFAHDGPAWVLVPSPDGKLIATIGHHTTAIDKFLDRDTVQVWDLTTGKIVRRLEARPKSWLMGLAFGPDNRTVVASASMSNAYATSAWNVATGERLWEVEDAGGSLLAISPDGKRLSTGRWPEYDLKTGKPVTTSDAHHARAPGVYLSGTGDRVVTIGYESISTWDGTTGRRLKSFEIPKLNSVGPWRVPSPDGRYAATVSDDDKQTAIHVWDVAGGRELHRLPMPGRHYGAKVGFSPDGSRLAVQVADTGTTIRLYDVRSGEEVRSLKDPGTKWPERLFFTADGKTLIVAGQRMVGLSLADGSEQFAYKIDPVPNPNSGVQVAPMGGVEVSPIAWRALAMAPDASIGCCVLSGGFGSQPMPERLMVFDGRTGKPLRRWADSGKAGSSSEVLAFSPDGRLIASSDLADVHLWEAATGKKVRTFRGHRNEMESLTFSANGRRLASGSWDGTVLVWDLSAPARGEPADWWADLASPDAATAYAAVWRIADAADDVSLLLLKKHLRPITATETERIARLIADLDSNQFRVRDRAFKELSDLGHAARPALRAALAKKPSAESASRLEQLLSKPVGPPSAGESLRTWRALAALEAKGTPAAAAFLKELAAGADGWLTDEAKAAVNRLAATR